MTAIELNILQSIQEWRVPWLDRLMVGISFLGNAGWIWIALAVACLFFPKKRKLGITIGVALLLSLIMVNWTIKPLVSRARPFTYYENFRLLILIPAETSFPSGHASSSFAAATACFIGDKKLGSFALILAVLIAFSRLYLFVHFPSDVLAGVLFGVLWALLAHVIVKAVSDRLVKLKRPAKLS